jgi:signal transduction histidine kinase
MMGVGTVQIVVAIFATVLVTRYERQRSYAMLEAGLTEHAAMVTSVIEPPDSPKDRAILHRELLIIPKGDVYILSDPAGNVIASSSDWRPSEPLPASPRSFVNTKIAGHHYRMLIERNVAMFDDNPEEMARLPKLTLIYGARVGKVEEHVDAVTWAAAWIGLSILLVSLAATGWAVRIGLQPLMRLAASATQIDEQNWQMQPEELNKQTVELAPLSSALIRLVERLRAAFLRERQFFADAAHEMKTAIAIVKSTLQLAIERDGAVANYRVGIERALKDTERMQGLASEMLQLAKIERLALEGSLVTVPLDIVAEVYEVEHQLAPLLAARTIRLLIQASDQPIFMQISKENMQIVLNNLIENAIHYSEDGTTIRVKIEMLNNDSVITVSDEGCGIDAEALPHIFERFYRGDASRSRESGGAGLGLSIVQAIVQRAGGSVTAKSSTGNGSEFCITLPQGG